MKYWQEARATAGHMTRSTHTNYFAWCKSNGIQCGDCDGRDNLCPLNSLLVLRRKRGSNTHGSVRKASA
eukprot:359644-Chlamydomonas_euryale.AAC.4